MSNITKLSRSIPVVDKNGLIENRFRRWCDDVTDKVNTTEVIKGSGSPNNIVAAQAGTFYVDVDAIANPFLFFKLKDELFNDPTRAWSTIETTPIL